jgi:hypothetical protein
MRKLFTFLVMLIAMRASGQWLPDVRLTNDPAISYVSFNNAWCVASSGSLVHVVWFDARDGNNEIYYKRSTNAGLNWESDMRFTYNAFNSQLPAVAASGSVVYVVWVDNRNGNWEIFYKHSTDAGLNWSSDFRLTSDSAVSWAPSLAVSGSVVHVVWYDARNGNNEIYYKRSSNAGTNWSADTRLTNNTASSSLPSVSVSGSRVLVVWCDDRDGNNEIYCKSSTDAGVTWTAETRLTNNSFDSIYPSVSISGMFANVVWEDNRDGNLEIYNKNSQDAGLSWGADMRLTNNNAQSQNPSVVVSVAAPVIAVHVVWFDSRISNNEIYYKNSIDGGNTWSADIRLTNSSGDPYSASVAASGSAVHVVWNDSRDGNYEIYYKGNPTGNIVGVQNISTEIPSSYSLSQNYPNPFNPSTTIKFSIVSSPHGLGGDLVLLKVFDILGNEVATLVNEKLNAGTYSVNWDASVYPSGVYYYRLQTEGYSDTKRMMLLK